jgi:hypothetical protein
MLAFHFSLGGGMCSKKIDAALGLAHIAVDTMRNIKARLQVSKHGLIRITSRAQLLNLLHDTEDTWIVGFSIDNGARRVVENQSPLSDAPLNVDTVWSNWEALAAEMKGIANVAVYEPDASNKEAFPRYDEDSGRMLLHDGLVDATTTDEEEEGVVSSSVTTSSSPVIKLYAGRSAVSWGGVGINISLSTLALKGTGAAAEGDHRPSAYDLLRIRNIDFSAVDNHKLATFPIVGNDGLRQQQHGETDNWVLGLNQPAFLRGHVLSRGSFVAFKSQSVLRKVRDMVLSGRLSVISEEATENNADDDSVVSKNILFRGSVLGEPAGSAVSKKYLVAAAALMRSGSSPHDTSPCCSCCRHAPFFRFSPR